MEHHHKEDGLISSRALWNTPKMHLPTINSVVREMIPGPFKTYKSFDKEENKETNGLRYPMEILNTHTAGSALHDPKKIFKKRFIVMLLRNLERNNGDGNGI